MLPATSFYRTRIKLQQYGATKLTRLYLTSCMGEEVGGGGVWGRFKISWLVLIWSTSSSVTILTIRDQKQVQGLVTHFPVYHLL